MIIGVSESIRRALDLAERFARTKAPVLLVGPRGSGKELLARHIHHASGRPGKFVDVNCGAVPPGVAESLLFGHERGAFTDARVSHVGWLEDADRGTLFLDEFVDMPADCQVKMLRALELGEIRPVGGRNARAVDLRVVAAAQEDLLTRRLAGVFRTDLLDRVAVGVIHLPPLSARGADLEILATHFAGLDGRKLEPGVVQVLANHNWPGNIRELRAVIARAGCLVDNGTLSPAAVAEAIAMGIPDSRAVSGRRSRARDRLPQTDAGWIALGETQGWKARHMAAAMDVGRSTLFAELRAQGRSLTELRSPGVRARVWTPPGLLDSPAIQSRATR